MTSRYIVAVSGKNEKEDSHVGNKQSIKLFLILILGSIYIFSFSHFGAFAYDSLFNKKSFDKGTSIGTVNISGLTKTEASQLINNKWTNWQNKTTITVHYKEKTEVFDNTLFTFLEKESFNKLKQGQNNQLFVKLDSLDTFLSFISPTLTNAIDIEKLKSDLLAKAKSLETGKIEIQLAEYLLDPTFEQNHMVKKVVLQTNFSADEQNLINAQLHEMELAPRSQFSLIKHVEALGLQQVSSEMLSCIATGIYQVILPTNFSIIERDISEELPDYAKLGFEAKVNIEKNKDLVFLNGNASSYKIQLKAIDDRIIFSLIGPSFINEYKIITKDQQNYTPKTIVQFNPQLSPTQKIVEKEGEDGQSIRVDREIFTGNGELVNRESISEDFYPPVHRVEVHGLIVHQSDNKTEDDSANTTDTQTSDSSDSTTKGKNDTSTNDVNTSSNPIAGSKNNDGGLSEN